jgi:hypothetical protein
MLEISNELYFLTLLALNHYYKKNKGKRKLSLPLDYLQGPGNLELKAASNFYFIE